MGPLLTVKLKGINGSVEVSTSDTAIARRHNVLVEALIAYAYLSHQGVDGHKLGDALFSVYKNLRSKQ